MFRSLTDAKILSDRRIGQIRHNTEQIQNDLIEQQRINEQLQDKFRIEREELEHVYQHNKKMFDRLQQQREVEKKAMKQTESIMTDEMMAAEKVIQDNNHFLLGAFRSTFLNCFCYVLLLVDFECF